MSKVVTLMIYALIILTGILNAQWSSNPAVNLTVCDLTGEQALAKIGSTSDGGCYISWFDNRGGSYAVYLQRFDELGNKMWDTDGLLISSNPQSSSLVDYDLIVDDQDNAVIAFTDTRVSSNRSVFVYRISPNGDFLWGADGIGLSSSTDFQANPKLAQTSDGNFVIAWIIAAARSQVGLQKVSPSGVKLWGADPVVLQSATEGFNYPAVVPTDSNGVILFHTVVTGNFPAQTVKLAAKKITSDGSVSWNVKIQDLGRIAAFSVPKVYSDRNNGGLIAWHDDRDLNSLQSGFVQRIASNGSLYFPVNGAEASLKTARNKFNPVAAFDGTTGETYLFWVETEPNQSQNGISGQKLSVNGTRQWTDDAKVFKDLSSPNSTSISYLNAEMGNARAYLFYLEGAAAGLNDIAEGFACDANGGFLWPGNFITLSGPTNDKLQMVSTVDLFKNCKLAWGDERLDPSRGIYAQDINPDGELGNSVVPVELGLFTATAEGGSVTLNWSTLTETNNRGFEIERAAADDRNWIKLDFIAGKGTTAEPQSYSYIDNSIAPGSYLYRLKQLDFDGSYAYSNVLEVNFNQPIEFILEQNYPNPFNPATKIKYRIPNNVKGNNASAALVDLKVLDILGREIAVLVNEPQSPGIYEVEFDASYLPSGVYFYRLKSEGFADIKKMLLLK